MRRATRADRGSAPVEFVLVGALLTFLFLLVLQVGFVLHARNVLVASAAEGARYAANADRSAGDGAQRAHEFVAESLSGAVADRISYAAQQTTGPGGVPVVEVTISGPLPLVLLPAGPLHLTVTGHAIDERL